MFVAATSADTKLLADDGYASRSTLATRAQPDRGDTEDGRGAGVDRVRATSFSARRPAPRHAARRTRGRGRARKGADERLLARVGRSAVRGRVWGGCWAWVGGLYRRRDRGGSCRGRCPLGAGGPTSTGEGAPQHKSPSDVPLSRGSAPYGLRALSVAGAGGFPRSYPKYASGVAARCASLPRTWNRLRVGGDGVETEREPAK